jgi:TolB protein
VEFNLGWSHDGSRLIFNHGDAEQVVGLVNVANPDPRALFTSKRDDSGFLISPDGSTILFTSRRSGNRDLWSVAVAGGEPARLTRSPMPEDRGRWLPDGQTIVFDSRRAGNWNIYTMSPDGENVVQLTDWPGYERVGELSPDGSLIAFYSNNETTEEDIWIVPAAGGTPRRITTLDAEPGGLQWSPDGQSLAFTKSSSPSNPLMTLNRVSVNGGPVQELFEGDVHGVQWSPDGRELVLSIIQDGYTRVQIMPSEGGIPRRVTNLAQEWDISPHWTSDGAEIVFQSQIIAGKGLWEIKAVTVSDGAVRVLAQDSSRNFNYESWGANQESVLFSSFVTDSPVDEVRIGDLLADLGH